MTNRIVGYVLASPMCWISDNKFFIELSDYAVASQDLETLDVDYYERLEPEQEGGEEEKRF